jgi:hypothetical protein
MNGHAKFLTHLLLLPRPDGQTWTVEEPFAYSPASGGHLTVPTGFVTDLASIPPLGMVGGLVMGAAYGLTLAEVRGAGGLFLAGWAAALSSAWLKPFGKFTEAAVLHDWLYRSHCVSRAVADALLLEAMTLCRVPRWQRMAIYLNVRLFGWAAWRNEKRWVPQRTRTQP